MNKDEKMNLCNWLCEKGTAADFENFKGVLKLIERILLARNDDNQESP